ncbi:MAG: helix-turn-helix domain-containing protein [Oscillatoriales cyanobacterium]|nr:MAG: helix-turn-helix domain-containing protein [Oscillatoriales cyanobacterium]TAH18740.1 MAG: helix-turn-helix domain-containing protein [Oscillatoriales cyanobacterium]
MQNQIRVLRTERQWSQAQLAERLGVSRQTINALEAGKYDPSLPLALKIAQLFNIPIEAIFSQEEVTMFAKQSPSNFSNLPETPLAHRFTPRTIKVINLAQEEAGNLGHNWAGTEQILLGLIEERTGIAARVLNEAGVNFRATRIEVEKIIGRGSGFVTKGQAFSPTARAKSLLNCAARSASELGHSYIDTEHLLLGLLRVDKPDRFTEKGQGVAVKVLQNLGIDLEVLEQQVLQVATRGEDLGIVAPIASQSESTQQAASIVGSSDNSTTDFVSAEISARFCALLFAWIEPRKLGRAIGYRTEFHLPDGNVLTPRIAFVAAERLKRVPRIYPELAPDMFVEIKSVVDRSPRLHEQVQAAIALGVKVGLLIDPDEQTVTIYHHKGAIATLRDRDVLTVPELLPGWELPVANLWSPMF